MFTENAIRYVGSIPVSALLLKLSPHFFRSLLAGLTTIGTRFFYSRCAQLLEHHFADRISSWHQNPAALPNKYADWSVSDVFTRDDAVEKTPDMLSKRLMTLNFAAIHTSTMTTANMIIDIASGSAYENCLTEMLVECQALSEEYGSQWSSARIAEMVIIDSALRESMRVSGFGSKAFVRKVMASNGILLPNGVRIPKGEIVSVSGYSMHHDKDIYPRPHEFRYDRFLQHSTNSKWIQQRTQASAKAATTTEVTYAIWGHGKHACPGRFFAVNLVKMLVAYIIENYELKPWNERPANVWVGNTPIPPKDLMIINLFKITILNY